jgi:hypothetical protein
LLRSDRSPAMLLRSTEIGAAGIRRSNCSLSFLP